ncbi:hypothetical protein [Actinomadura gamaensis]|uniref:SHSP domain-containing protein n=1 Tax=Actinomadura gamaensis TaxID=1763541 RepID=A0ABV9U4L2_9ACTN
MAAETGGGDGPHAEIGQVWPRDGHIRILGTVVSGGAPDEAPVDEPWTLRLTSRERRKAPAPGVADRIVNRLKRSVTRSAERTPSRLYFPVVTDGPHFEAVVPVRDLAVRDALPREHWDLHLVSARGGRRLVLRVGRHHDDMPGKKKIVKFPEQTEAGVDVLPYYTDGDHLSVRCARRDSANRAEA